MPASLRRRGPSGRGTALFLQSPETPPSLRLGGCGGASDTRGQASDGGGMQLGHLPRRTRPATVVVGRLGGGVVRRRRRHHRAEACGLGHPVPARRRGRCGGVGSCPSHPSRRSVVERSNTTGRAQAAEVAVVERWGIPDRARAAGRGNALGTCPHATTSVHCTQVVPATRRNWDSKFAVSLRIAGRSGRWASSNYQIDLVAVAHQGGIAHHAFPSKDLSTSTHTQKHPWTDTQHRVRDDA